MMGVDAVLSYIQVTYGVESKNVSEGSIEPLSIRVFKKPNTKHDFPRPIVPII
jgi:hypothetical protein